jgi:hypothetical protein
MGARYENAGNRQVVSNPTEASMWDDLDRGIDPTDRP